MLVIMGLDIHRQKFWNIVTIVFISVLETLDYVKTASDKMFSSCTCSLQLLRLTFFSESNIDLSNEQF